MNESCGCCEGIEILTPITIANRPGLNTLAYRVGTHASFLTTMKARLSDSKFPPLANLKTRDAYEPSIALLDAWATVADVLTFYQERIANEGYLLTATERFSIIKLAGLIDYPLHPGVSASVYLAFTLEDDYNIEIPAGTSAQSASSSGEMPIFFETTETLSARTQLNNLKIRTLQPQQIVLKKQLQNTNLALTDATQVDKLYLEGLVTNLEPSQPLLLVFGDAENQQVLRQVQTFELQRSDNYTQVTLQTTPDPSKEAPKDENGSTLTPAETIEQLLKPLLPQPANPLALERTLDQIFNPNLEIRSQLMRTLQPELNKAINYILTSRKDDKSTKEDLPLQHIEALRIRAAPFGNNASLKRVDRGSVRGYEEWSIAPPVEIMVAINLSNGGVPSQQALIFCNRDSQQSTAQVLLGNDSSPSTSTVNLEGLTVTINFSLTNAPLAYQYVFTFQELNRVITLTTEQVGWGVQIQGQPTKQVVSLGQTLQYSVDNRKVIISFAQTDLSVWEDSPSPLSGDLRQVLALDAQYNQIVPRSWIAIARPDWNQPRIYRVEKTENIYKTEYGMGGRITQLTLDKPWLEEGDISLEVLRKTTVYAQGEVLTLADKPIYPKNTQGENLNGTNKPTATPAQTLSSSNREIELDDLYEGLQAGRWLIISGERTDMPDIQGIKASEVVMLAKVRQGVDPNLPGDKPHTFIQLAQPLAYSYKPDTVTIYGNVVKSTHGETRTEVLGSGDSTKALQKFTLSLPFVTHLATPTSTGAHNTLAVRVNDILWDQVESLAELGPTDRGFVTHTDDQGKTTIIFGNGHNGARLPKGIENVEAVYRTGVGKEGNVKAEQISQLPMQPLGVKSVLNPLPATNGTDRESFEQARRNAPSKVISLDRAVSVQDYGNFVRTFAGISKASTMRLSDGNRQIIHLTIAGADDIPIDKNSDTYRNLLQALYEFGDSHQPIRVDSREIMLLIISAKVRILPDFQWKSVAPNIRVALLDTFSFERRELGQDVVISEVISTIQLVTGVDYVVIDILESVREAEAKDPESLKTKLKQLVSAGNRPGKAQPKPSINVNLATVNLMAADRDSRIQPAQLAILSPKVPDTLILKELRS